MHVTSAGTVPVPAAAAAINCVLHGDAHPVFAVKPVYHIVEVFGKLILMGMPPRDGDGLCHVILGGCQSKCGNEQER